MHNAVTTFIDFIFTCLELVKLLHATLNLPYCTLNCVIDHAYILNYMSPTTPSNI